MAVVSVGRTRWCGPEGPRRTADLFTAAAAEGIPERTLYRAKEAERVESRRVKLADRAEWYWYDPDAPWPADAPFNKPRVFELPDLPDVPFPD